MPWRKVIDPVTGKSRFTNEPVAVNSAPVNKVEKKADGKYCAECDKEITGRLIHALDKDWHAECFACTSCNRQFEMNAMTYTVEDGKAYCLKCMEAKDKDAVKTSQRTFIDCRSGLVNPPELVSTQVRLGAAPTYGGGAAKSLASAITKPVADDEELPDDHCVACRSKIVGVAVGTEFGFYHDKCFVCGRCGDSIPQQSGHRFHKGQPLHPDCFKKATAPPCGYCGQPAYGKCYKVKDTKYHQQCYICTVCSKSLSNGHLEKDGKLFCSSACKTNYVPGADAKSSDPPLTAPNDAPTSIEPVADAAAAPTPKFCANCGAADPKKFCGNCGTATS